MQSTEANHYTVLGLDRRCTEAQIKTAYRLLARQHHPDLNPESAEALARTQALNAAYEVLSDPERRTAYDAELAAKKSAPPNPARILLPLLPVITLAVALPVPLIALEPVSVSFSTLSPSA